jgi:hypothetical protein
VGRWRDIPEIMEEGSWAGQHGEDITQGGAMVNSLVGSNHLWYTSAGLLVSFALTLCTSPCKKRLLDTAGQPTSLGDARSSGNIQIKRGMVEMGGSREGPPGQELASRRVVACTSRYRHIHEHAHMHIYTDADPYTYA